MQVTGHQTIQMTELYAHLGTAHLHKTVVNLPKRGITLVGVEEKAVCEPNNARKQSGLDFWGFSREIATHLWYTTRRRNLCNKTK